MIFQRPIIKPPCGTWITSLTVASVRTWRGSQRPIAQDSNYEPLEYHYEVELTLNLNYSKKRRA